MEMQNNDFVRRQKNPLTRFINLFDSIWLGIFWMAIIVVYATVGSAIPPVRQEFELTEFQYFNHWIFITMIALFCATLVVTTVRRIQFNWRNAGVLTVHTGLLVLCAGSVIYFGRKIEGDVWLDAPSVRVISVDRFRTDPDRAVIGRVVAVEGKVWETSIPALGGRHRVEVASVEHQGLITAKHVTLKARVGNGPEQTIELDQSKEGGAFAKFGDQLVLALAPANIADSFYDESTPILAIESRNHTETFELPGLPYYKERFLSAGDPIVDTEGRQVESDRALAIPPFEYWRMPIPLTDPERAIAADWPVEFEIDGYLPYAKLDPRPMPGGEQVMPIARAALSLPQAGPSASEWLIPMMPDRSMIEVPGGPMAEFTWIDQQTNIDPEWTKPLNGTHLLEVHIRDKNVRASYDVAEGQTIQIGGTDYSIQIEQLQPSWPLMSPGFQNARTPIALVWVEGPTRKFQRSVLDRYPALNQDRDRQGKRIDPNKAIVDDNIELRYFDASRDRYRVVAGQSLSPTLIHTAPGGKRTVKPLGSTALERSDSGATFAWADYIMNPRFETQAVVIPERNRRPFGTVRRGESAIRVHLRSTKGNWERRVWVPYSLYNTTHDGTTPTAVADVPGLGEIRFIYGRATRPLPARLALEWLQTDFYPGRQQPSGWTSHFRAQDYDSNVVVRDKAFLNNTARVGEWTLFQSQAAGDHESWTVLGVGNRQGVMAMLAGCVLITLGMIYAFCVKPILVQRRKRGFAGMKNKNDSRAPTERTDGASRRPAAVVGLIALLAWGSPARSDDGAGSIPPAAKSLAAIQSQIDLDRLGALALQHGWRYSTMDSWARDAVKSVHGAKPLFGLDPVVAAIELMFNEQAYHDQPIIYIKDRPVLKELTAHPIQLSDKERSRIIKTGMVSFDFLATPGVSARIEQLSMDPLKKTAMDRLSNTLGYYQTAASTCTIVPDPSGTNDTPWISIADLDRHAGNVPASGAGARLVSTYADWKKAWLARDVAGINAAIKGLDELLPALAPKGVYPTLEQRHAEVTYRRLGLIRWGWVCYIMAFFVSIFAVATRYRWVRVLGLILLMAAIGLHGADLAMRWRVIGRIPVANMYEAVVSSTWVGAVFGLMLELFLKKRVYLLSSALLGFFALSLPELLPNVVDNKLGGMMPILDDIMLRIHTVLIISSYAVITLAFGVANCYLFVAAFRDRSPLAQGTIGAQAGALASLVLAKMGYLDALDVKWTILAGAGLVGGGIFLARGLCGMLLQAKAAAPALTAEGFPVRANVLEEFDLSHRVLLYTATIALFAGLVLGAVWADYSWGRPWGWDPKEVFALNTWLIYAILIHARFVTRKRALWTSVLSVFGFAAMQFNWWVVNFYIVGLHSYA